MSPTVRRGAGRFSVAGVLALALGPLCLALPPSRAAADPAAPAPLTSEPAGPAGSVKPPALTPFAGNVELEDRLDTAGKVTVAGERMHEHLLRRFYNAHGYETVWNDHPDAAAALWRAILHAGDHGLDPASYHSAILSGRWAALSPIGRDLLLSDAFLSYADALARGAVPVGDRDDAEDLTPEPVDVVGALDKAITAPEPEKAIVALAPSSPGYLALRQAYAAYLAIAERGRGAGNGRGPWVSATDAQRRLRQLAVNLERLRWLPRNMPADRLVVDTAVAQLQLFRDNQPVFTTRVVVGEVDKQTPELQSVVDDILFNPPWNIPRSIVEKEIWPRLASDRHYLTEHHMRFRGPMAVQQEAGPYSALGRLKFEMSDRFDVYLHDTPEKWRFHAASRMMSHGCVRVENPRALASLLLGQSPEFIDKEIDVNRTHGRALPKPVPVFIVYRTAVVESDGAIAFRGDPYRRDDEIWASLNRTKPSPMAQDIATGQRKG